MHNLWDKITALKIGAFPFCTHTYLQNYKVSIKERTSRVPWNYAALLFYCVELCRAAEAVKSDVNCQMSNY
jgi:hypothetical protein